MNRWVRLAIALLAGLFAVGGVWLLGPSPRVRLSGGQLMPRALTGAVLPSVVASVNWCSR